MAKNNRKDVQQRINTMRKYTEIEKQRIQESGVNKKPRLKVYEFPEDATTYDELRKAYLKLADTADRRLRRLEEYASKDKSYEDILKFSYAKAMYDIEAQRGEGKNRFMGGVPKKGNILTIQSRINDVLKFLNSPSSTIEGINIIYGERARTINDIYGLDLTAVDMGDFFENDFVQNAISTFASDTAMKVLGKYYRNKDEIDKLFKQYNKDKKAKKLDIKAFKSEQTNTKLTAQQMEFLYNNKGKAAKLFK